MIDLRDPAFRDDPHPLLHALRGAVDTPRDATGAWLVCHHADALAGLRNNRLSREPWRAASYASFRPFLADSEFERLAAHWMLFNDPPKHTRLRGLVSAAFKPPVIEALRGRIVAIADQLVGILPSEGTFDVMSALAQPLPVRVICDVLGLPGSDYAVARQWSDTLATILEPMPLTDRRLAAARAGEDMAAHLRAHVHRHRARDRRDTLLGMLIAAQETDGALSDDELLGNLILLFIAGHETTSNLIGNGLLCLLSHPRELARLRAEPRLLGTAVEEMLRCESPVSAISRIVVEPTPLRGSTMAPGDVLFVLVGAANRDPAVFADPDRFDITRSPNPHLGFGAGIHYCMGAQLARLEAEIAFTRLLQRYQSLALADGPCRWRPFINLRGLESLVVRAG